MKNIRYSFLAICALIVINVSAQAPKRYSSSEIYLNLKKLNVLGNVLYVAAHPDDENTRMITYLENGKLVSAAYLSLTRGDGGQNLIGPEIKEQLGILRTQELLAARRRDGGEQFFTRANDFGYSKNTEETERIWERDKVLGDVVWTFRKFRPDVVITRFPPDARAGHGHHTTSAILALEAFRMAGNPKAYPEQLKYVETWQPSRMVMNTGRWWNNAISKDDQGVVVLDVGGYNPELGQSYTEISAVSRSQHRSQGFGATGSRGEQIEYLEYFDGSQADNDLFEGIDMTWGRVQGGSMVTGKISKLVSDFDVSAPAKSIPALIDLKIAIAKIEDTYWRSKKLEEVDELIKACAGLYLEAVATKYSVVPGEKLNIKIELTNRSETTVKLKSIMWVNYENIENHDLLLEDNKAEFVESNLAIPDDMPISNPYWLNKKGSLGMYSVDDLRLIGKPENDPAFRVSLGIEIDGSLIHYVLPVIYKWNDRVKGEQRRQVIVTPPVMLSVLSNVIVFPSSDPQQVDIKVIAGIEGITPNIELNLPPNWRSEPVVQRVTFHEREEEKVVSFMVYPPGQQEVLTLHATAELEGKKYSRGIATINYDHIPIQTLFPKAVSKLVRLDIKKRGSAIGYVMGAGDEMPSSLEQIGYSVRMLKTEDITSENLANLDAVIVGIRALNTHPELRNYKKALLDFVYEGGTLIYQYNTSRGINWKDFAPYELGFTGRSSDSRVSVEEAEITILMPDNPVLNSPNKITGKDFEGWVQERGLYFPSTWDPRYEAVLSSHDPGEDPKDGGLLIAKYGKGYYVYTGYAWFRQLPAGVPGAYRLFANIISLSSSAQTENSTIRMDNK